ncbi:LytTR family DNA-binding domain-containing protein [Solibacillus sp. MA9]|uniref:LytTR family DNA-binding domain-containing protein n=1 Tax=Solibacillus palustris TaxID=2908203 RepID=A0ABS9UI19_9BACL|nr:LytTR family DNA-binding domain-containing protein [Solibacillus sp. MA9]MCH7323739.1 LytTR family DNA-binding domain-containing protein [Solibacillus sp. MA9]
MSIFILEDDLYQAQQMQQLIGEICEKKQIPYNFIEATSRADEILSKIALCTYTPIYFLDIEIKQETRKGLEVAREIRNVDPHGIIVFVTTHSELAPISYQYMVSALTFIEKDLPHETRRKLITECLAQYVTKNNTLIEEDYFVVDNAYTTIKVPFSTVEYIMTDEPHRLQLGTTNQLIQFYGTLKEIEQMDTRFIRCHKSVLINKKHVQQLDTKQQLVYLTTGKQVPVSRRLMKTIKALLKEG